MQEPARSAGVDHEPRRDPDGPAVPLAFEDRAVSLVAKAFEPCHVQVDRAFGLRLLRERLIEVRPVPMRVGDVVVRARRHQQLPLAIRRRPRTRRRAGGRKT